MPIYHTYKTQEEWLELRSHDVTSTEVAALFGLSPYTTEFELYHSKIGGQAKSFSATERMKWGNRLESAIAYGVAEDYGIRVEPLKDYVRHSECLGMGSSFDFIITGIVDNFEGSENEFRNAFHKYGQGILEIKNVDGRIYNTQWQDNEAPDHIETQVQHQMEVLRYQWTVICPLVGGNEAKPFIRMRDEEVGKVLCKSITDFWYNVVNGIEPKPDYSKDAEFVISLHQSAGGKAIDASDNEDLIKLLNEYNALAQAEKRAADGKQSVKAAILDIIGDSPKVTCGAYSLSCSMTAETPATVITEEMIGQTYGGRKGFRNFRLTKKGE